MSEKGNTIIFGLIITLVLVFAGVGFVFVKNRSPEITSSAPKEPTQDSANNRQNFIDKNGQTQSRYILYSPASFETESEKRRVLYFYANWCPICRPADANLKANENRIPEDVVVIRVNYNDSDTDQDEKKLAEKYGVTYQHTFVQIDQNANEVTKWNGGEIEELLDRIK